MKKQKQQTSSKDYEILGKKLVDLYESGYFKSSKKEVFKTSFIKGVLAGFGGVLGATVMIALMLWFLSFFQEVPLIGPFVQKVESTIQASQYSTSNQ